MKGKRAQGIHDQEVVRILENLPDAPASISDVLSDYGVDDMDVDLNQAQSGTELPDDGGILDKEVIHNYQFSKEEAVPEDGILERARNPVTITDINPPEQTNVTPAGPMSQPPGSSSNFVPSFTVRPYVSDSPTNIILAATLNCPSAVFAATLTTLQFTITYILSEFKKHHLCLLFSFPFIFGKLLLEETPFFSNVDGVTKLVECLKQDFETLVTYSAVATTSDLEGLLNQATEEFVSWICQRRRIRVVKLVVDNIRPNQEKQNRKFCVVDGSCLKSSYSGNKYMTLKVGRRLKISSLLRHFDGDVLVIKPIIPAGTFLRISPGSLPKDELVRVELVESTTQLLVGCVVHNPLSVVQALLLFLVGKMCSLDRYRIRRGPHNRSPTGSALVGVGERREHLESGANGEFVIKSSLSSISSKFSMEVANEVAVKLFDGFWWIFPDVVVHPFFKFQRDAKIPRGQLISAMYFGENYVAQMHTDENDQLPFSFGLCTNNDPDGKHIRGGDFMYWNHSVLLEMSNNLAWAWRAVEFDHGTAVMEWDKGYYRYVNSLSFIAVGKMPGLNIYRCLDRFTCAYALNKNAAKNTLTTSMGAGADLG
ncbi:hypothetical protein M427DRAFT_477238 [Gonapodya prolifera JEL478]|uniref:Uncharacterized protein n=1 Tax=Gonapodya prolifera (strain JEL478) TaxID=1344416 RepID=A0A139A1R5_GONPJ|nr:hypothetical protein M427DRAFT_477238 [Gonapodya prolifera JEL478]|eukprot:KXS10485.1 hypothetical protein M427DRAFT_477238 [Gonapodya prolifera JEL478]